MVDSEYYGTRSQSTPQQVLEAGTLEYKFNGEWTTNLPISNQNILYIPTVTLPSGTVQYYYNSIWNNSLPSTTSTNGVDYAFVLATNVNSTNLSYYYNNTWNVMPPMIANVDIIPVIVNSQTTTQYFYNEIWSDEFPNLANNTVYVAETQFGNNITMYQYNGSYTMIPPQTMVFVNMRVGALGTQEYYYGGQWTNTTPTNTMGQVFVYVQQVVGQPIEYFYNDGFNVQQPSGFTLIPTRLLLYQNLLYYYGNTLQNVPPPEIQAPMFIVESQQNGNSVYGYNGANQLDPPNLTNEVFVIQDPNYITSQGITTLAYYYDNTWAQEQPLILTPSIELNVTVTPSGTLTFGYNNQQNAWPPTESMIIQQRTLSQTTNQYYYDGNWQNSPYPNQTAMTVFYLPTRVLTTAQVKYYYDGNWQNIPQYIFDATLCPRCYGKGYYLDIPLNEAGQALLIDSTGKLEQQVLKILTDPKGSNIFHPRWGNDVSEKLLGHKNTSYAANRLRFLIVNALEYLKQVQLDSQARWNNMSADEIIYTINYVNVIPSSLTGYSVIIDLTSAAGTSITHNLVF